MLPQGLRLKINLILELVFKDLKVRYQRPVLGFVWLALSPLLIVFIFYLVFSLILKVKIGEAPFVLYLMSAVFTWRFFQDSLSQAATSLVENRNLIREANFQYYLIPVSCVLANCLNFLSSLLILIISSLLALKGLPMQIIFLPLILFMHLLITIGLAVVFSILYVRWRDLKYALELFLLLLFYLTPVFYSLSFVKSTFPELWFKIYLLNPFTCILNLYRIALLKDFAHLAYKDIGLSILVASPLCFGLLVSLWGVYLYKRKKKSINDYLAY